MRKKTTTSQRIRSLIDSGYNNKAIIEKLKCKPQAVYNIRYQLNKARGLGSIGALPNPTDGIGAPPKRTRKIRAGTGIKPEPYGFGSAPIKTEGQPVDYMFPVTMIEPKPTLWQRVVRFFKGN